MKKLLALVLALVMTLGLATVSSSAAYSDAADIEYTEAVDVMTAVGVFQGKGDSFAPNDNLNRAEAAKLVAYLMLGNKTAESMIGSGTRFTDVPASHWAAGFIEYLASVGIVSGVGNGNFDPNGQVTGVQFAKMLLVALGYDAEIEKFVGDGWSINIQKIANQNDLFSGLDISANAALTRQQAAQMCLNDLKANMVEYEDKGTTVNVGGATVVTGVKNAKEIAQKGGKNYISNGGSADDAKYHQLAEELYGSDLKLDDAGRDDFGRPANKWTYKLEKVGTYAATGDLMGTYTAEVKRGPIYDLVGKTVYDNLVDGKSDLYFFEDGVGYNNTSSGLVNGTAATRLTDVEKFVQKNGDKAIYAGDSSGNGSLTQVYVDDDDNVTITVVNTYIFQASSDYRKSTQDIVVSVPSDAAKQAVTSVDNNRLKLEDFPEIESFKKDDYLLVTAYKDGNKWTADSVAKAELKTATVDKVVVEDSITLDGTVTKYGKKATSDTKKTEYSVGQETTVVLDKYGYILYVDDAVVANNYVFISELYQNGGTTTNVMANAYFTDGTNKAITVKKVAGTSAKNTLVGTTGNANMHVGVVKADDTTMVSNLAGWYTYTVNSSNEYTLNALSDSYHEENGYAAGTKTLTNSDAVKFIASLTEANNPYPSKTAINPASGATAKANDKTIMVVTYADKTDVDVYTGVKNIPEIKLTAADGKGAIFSVLDSSNYAKYVFVTLEGSTSVFGTESENLLYVVKYDHKNREKDNNTYYTYKALDENAKEITIEASENLGSGDIYAAYYKTSKDSDGRYTRIEPVVNQNGKYMEATGRTQSTGKIVADGNTLDIGGDSFTLADNYKLVVVSKVDTLNRLIKDNSGYEADIMTAEGLEGLLQDYNYTYNVQAKTDDTYTAGKGGKLVEAYVTITAATARNAAASTYTLTWNLADNAYKANITGVTVKVNDVAKSTATSGSLTVDKGAVVKLTVTTSAGYSATVSENNFAMNSNKTVTITGQAGIIYRDTLNRVSIDASKISITTGGQIRMPVTIPAAFDNYAEDAQATLTIDGDVYVDGAYAGTIGDLKQGTSNQFAYNYDKATGTIILGTGGTFAVGGVVTLGENTLTATYNKVAVKYMLSTTDISADMTATTPTTMTTNTTGAAFKMGVDSGKYTGDSVTFTVANATAKGGAFATAAADYTVTNGNEVSILTGGTVYADGDDYVVITLSGITKVPATFTVTNSTGLAAAAVTFTNMKAGGTNATIGYTGDRAAQTLQIIPATTAGLAEGSNVTIKVITNSNTLGTDAPFKVVLNVANTTAGTDEDVELKFPNGTTQKTYTIANLDANYTITVKSVTDMTLTTATLVDSAQYVEDGDGILGKGDTIVVKFKKALSAAPLSAQVTFTSPTGGTAMTLANTNAGTLSDDGKTVTWTVDNALGTPWSGTTATGILTISKNGVKTTDGEDNAAAITVTLKKSDEITLNGTTSLTVG